MSQEQVDVLTQTIPKLEINPADKTPFDLFKDEGNALVKAEKYVEALEKYQQAWGVCETNDNRAMILNNRGVVHEKMGETEKALAIFQQALDLKPDYIKVLLRRSMLHRKLKNFDQAVEDLSEAQVLAVKNHQHLAGLQENVGQLIMEYTESELEKIKATRTFCFPKDSYIVTYFRGFYCDPVSRMWKGLDPCPVDELQSTGQGDAQKNSGGFLAAMACMKAKEYSAVPDHCTAEIDDPSGKYRMEALLLRGSFHFLMGDCEGALLDFKEITSDANASKELRSSAHLKAALCQNLWGAIEDAATHFTEAEQIWSKNGDVYYHGAVCLVDKGEVVPALALLGKGAEECPDAKACPLLHVLRYSIQASYEALCGSTCAGVLSSSSSAVQETLGKLKELEQSGVLDNPECYEMYGQALLLLNQSGAGGGDGASEMFDKAVELAGHCKFFKLKKAMANLMKMTNREEALKTLEPFTEDLDVASVAYYHIGEINMMMQNFEAGFEAIEKSIEYSHSIYDVKLRVLGKVDFTYHARVAQKLRQYGVNMFAEAEEAHKALE